MTRTAQIILSDIPVRWDENHILIRIGCRNGRASASPLLLRMLAEVEAQVPSLIASRAVYTVVDHGETNGHPIFERAVQVALGIATIGPALEVQSEREFREGDLLRGLVLDAFGTAAVIQIFRAAERQTQMIDDPIGYPAGRRHAPNEPD